MTEAVTSVCRRNSFSVWDQDQDQDLAEIEILRTVQYLVIILLHYCMLLNNCKYSFKGKERD